MTKGERNVRDGHEERVLFMRKTCQATMRKELVSGIETLTGRRVVAFFSDNHIDPDMAVEVFALDPVNGGRLPGRTGTQPHRAARQG